MGAASIIATLLLGGSLAACSGADGAAPTATGPTPGDTLPEVQARAADAFVESIGVNTHLAYLDRVYGTGYETIIKPRLRELGVRHLRDVAQVIYNAAGWMTTVYGRWRELATYGMRFDAVATNPILNGSTGARGSYTDGRWVDSLVTYAGAGAIAVFEGVNEPDLFWGYYPGLREDVAASQRTLYAKVKGTGALADRPVLGPSLTSSQAAQTIGDLSSYLDVGAVHPYPGNARPSANLPDALTPYRLVSGSKPMMATETGYQTSPWSLTAGYNSPITEAGHGRYTARLPFVYWNAGLQRAYLYEFIDQAPMAADDPFSYGGLLRNDGSPKPAFTALKHTIALLADAGGAGFAAGRLRYALGGGDLTGVQTTLLQKRDGRFYLVVWQEVASFDAAARRDVPVAERALTLTLGTRASAVRVYRPLEGSAPVATLGATSTVSLSVPDHPLVVEIAP